LPDARPAGLEPAYSQPQVDLEAGCVVASSATQKEGIVTNRAEQRAHEVAEKAGVDDVKIVHVGLPDSDDDGVLIDIDAVGFGIMSFQLDLEDLGVELSVEDKRKLTNPSISTLPSRMVAHLRGGRETARKALYRYGAKRIGLPQRWVPWTAWEYFKADFQHGRDMFENARTECLTTYDALREETLTEVKVLAAKNGKRIRATKVSVSDDFEDQFVRKVMDHFPTEQQLNELDIKYRVSISQLTAEALIEISKAAKAQAEMAQLTLDQQLLEEQERLRVRLAEVKVWEEKQAAQGRLEAQDREEREERRIKDEIRNAKRREMQRMIEGQLSPLMTRLGEVRATIFEEAIRLKTTIEENRALPGATTSRIKTIATWFRNMNFSGDTSLEQLIDTLESMAGRPANSEARSYEDVAAVIDEMLVLTAESAREAQTSGRFAALEI
jgi:hypothetical protein